MDAGMLLLARFGLMADLALLMGLPLFWWAMGMAGQRALLVALALGGMALSALWLLASAASMTGTPLLPPDWATAEILLTMTPIGPVLVVRGVALLAALVLAVAGQDRWVLIPAAVAAATIAWTGHAGATEDVAGSVHRAADVAHIWAASGWIGALAALLHAVTARRPNIDRVAVMLAKFSLLGTLFVATLVMTGVVNSLMIVGVADLPALVGSRYGWLLGAKLAVFGAMLGLAALNRWRLTPALERGAEGAIAALRLSLLLETGAAIGILVLVAGLGTLDPLA
ncbi:copper homeostasis membrane protein CopD [Sphingobium sp. AS12]|uniref:copper homeostasis membrane protein CopD n=1 Tax=Sphingobium sp. AS12 TaxID=2849495 RepID=UPI0020C8B075|nr:copper homeostasis membrane protein CopD [Sphingobium sp. AS12]